MEQPEIYAWPAASSLARRDWLAGERRRDV
jgi:hypothetical protein